MNISRFKKVILSIVLFVVPTFHLFASSADRSQLKQDFKQTYSAYQKALAGDDLKLIEANAKKSYELGCQLFDKASDNCITLTTNYAMVAASMKLMEGLYLEALDTMVKEYGEYSVPVASFAISILNSPRVDGKVYSLFLFAYKQVNKVAKAIVESDPISAGTLYVLTAEAIVDKVYNDIVMAKGYNLLVNRIESSEPILIRSQALAAKYYLRKGERDKSLELSEELIQILDKVGSQSYKDIEIETRRFLYTEYEWDGKRKKADKHLAVVTKLKPWSEEAEAVFRVQPLYPANAARDKLEGWVELSFNVNERGRTENIEVIESSHIIFNREAKKALKRWRYFPKVIDGAAVKTDTYTLRLDFSLKK